MKHMDFDRNYKMPPQPCPKCGGSKIKMEAIVFEDGEIELNSRCLVCGTGYHIREAS